MEVLFNNVLSSLPELMGRFNGPALSRTCELVLQKIRTTMVERVLSKDLRRVLVELVIPLAGVSAGLHPVEQLKCMLEPARKILIQNSKNFDIKNVTPQPVETLDELLQIMTVMNSDALLTPPLTPEDKDDDEVFDFLEAENKSTAGVSENSSQDCEDESPVAGDPNISLFPSGEGFPKSPTPPKLQRKITFTRDEILNLQHKKMLMKLPVVAHLLGIARDIPGPLPLLTPLGEFEKRRSFSTGSFDEYTRRNSQAYKRPAFRNFSSDRYDRVSKDAPPDSAPFRQKSFSSSSFGVTSQESENTHSKTPGFTFRKSFSECICNDSDQIPAQSDSSPLIDEPDSKPSGTSPFENSDKKAAGFYPNRPDFKKGSSAPYLAKDSNESPLHVPDLSTRKSPSPYQGDNEPHTPPETPPRVEESKRSFSGFSQVNSCDSKRPDFKKSMSSGYGSDSRHSSPADSTRDDSDKKSVPKRDGFKRSFSSDSSVSRRSTPVGYGLSYKYSGLSKQQYSVPPPEREVRIVEPLQDCLNSNEYSGANCGRWKHDLYDPRW